MRFTLAAHHTDRQRDLPVPAAASHPDALLQRSAHRSITLDTAALARRCRSSSHQPGSVRVRGGHGEHAALQRSCRRPSTEWRPSFPVGPVQCTAQRKPGAAHESAHLTTPCSSTFLGSDSWDEPFSQVQGSSTQAGGAGRKLMHMEPCKHRQQAPKQENQN